MPMRRDVLDRLMAAYRFWGMTAGAAFLFFIILLVAVYRGEKFSVLMLFAALIMGFFWIGATSVCRHSFILLKNYLGCRVSVVEFLSTQFVVFLFPFAYRKVKREADAFRRRRARHEV
jgi:hypothetical protein